MVETHPLILSLRSAGLKELNPCNIDEVHTMWHAFSKAKNCIEGGDRYEYLSWRIYSREILLRSKRIETGATHSVHFDAGSLYEQDNTSDSDSSWESDSLDCTTNEDRDTFSLSPPGKSSAAFNDSERSPSVPKQDNAHRKLSSIELQSLFVNSRSPLPLLPKANLKAASTSALPTKAFLEEKADPTPENSSAPHEFYTYTDHQGDPITFEDPAKAGSPSAAIRGFSPSHISVSVFANRQLHDGDADKSNLQPSAESSTGSPTKPVDASSNLTKKMFYFGAPESDTESSFMGSPESQIEDGETTYNAPPARSETIEDEPSTVTGTPMASNDVSEWDDISDDDEEGSDNDATRRDMFQERVVPTEPLLKRSLLSTLFVNQVKDGSTSENNIDSNADSHNSVPPPVTAPVDILLGAPVAPHFPFPVERHNTNVSGDEWSGFNIIGGGIMGQREQDLYNRHMMQGSSTSGTYSGSSKHMDREPISPTRNRNSIEASPHVGWANQHEDIYDPMNYHSRGW